MEGLATTAWRWWRRAKSPGTIKAKDEPPGRHLTESLQSRLRELCHTPLPSGSGRPQQLVPMRVSDLTGARDPRVGGRRGKTTYPRSRAMRGARPRRQCAHTMATTPRERATRPRPGTRIAWPLTAADQSGLRARGCAPGMESTCLVSWAAEARRSSAAPHIVPHVNKVGSTGWRGHWRRAGPTPHAPPPPVWIDPCAPGPRSTPAARDRQRRRPTTLRG